MQDALVQKEKIIEEKDCLIASLTKALSDMRQQLQSASAEREPAAGRDPPDNGNAEGRISPQIQLQPGTTEEQHSAAEAPQPLNCVSENLLGEASVQNTDAEDARALPSIPEVSFTLPSSKTSCASSRMA